VPRPALRSRSLKRIWRRLPSGITKIHYVRRKSYSASCAICGRELNGIPRDTKIIRRGAKTEKRPERPYGGNVCPNCLASLIKLSVRTSSLS